MTVFVDPDAAPPSGVTLGDLVNRVQDQLSDRVQINLLSDAVDADTTTLRFVHPLVGIDRSTQLNIDDEIFYVWGTDNANKAVTVQRGWRSLAGVHQAQAVVSIGNLSQRNIITAINDELMRLSTQGLYQMRSKLLATTPSINSYGITGLDKANIYDAQYQTWGASGDWTTISGWSFANIDSTLSAMSPTSSVRVLYKQGFNKATELGDDIATTSGLHEEAHDILVWGACAALTTSEEFKRNDFRSQGDTRRPQEVPYRAMSLSRRDFTERRDSRLQEERDRLNRRFPHRKAGW